MSIILKKNSELPIGWEESNLDSLSLLITKGSTPTTYGFSYQKKGINFIKVENIVDGWIDQKTINEFISQDTNDYLKRSKLDENDILFSIAGTIGRTTIVRNIDLPANTNQAIAIIRCSWKYLNPKYVRLILDSPILFNSFSRKSRGVGIYNLSLNDIKELIIPIPPLKEQKRIVTKIEELFSIIDSTKQLLISIKNQLKQYRNSLLNECIEGTIFYDNISCPKKPIGELIESIGQGWSPKCENYASFNENDWAVMKTTAIQPLKFDYDQNKKLPDTLEPRNQLELKKGDLLITRAGPRTRVGIACLIKKTRKRLLLCDKAYRIRCKKNLVEPAFLEILLNTPHITKEINDLKTGISDSGVNITQDRFSHISIPCPPLNEQKRIVEKIEESLSFIEKNKKLVDKLLLQNNSIKNSILKQSFEGKLVLQDPNDEPAEILLEKIKQEKQKINSQTKRGKKNDK
jgi:type I restriction enzyme S subunit